MCSNCALVLFRFLLIAKTWENNFQMPKALFIIVLVLIWTVFSEIQFLLCFFPCLYGHLIIYTFIWHLRSMHIAISCPENSYLCSLTVHNRVHAHRTLIYIHQHEILEVSMQGLHTSSCVYIIWCGCCVQEEFDVALTDYFNWETGIPQSCSFAFLLRILTACFHVRACWVSMQLCFCVHCDFLWMAV